MFLNITELVDHVKNSGVLGVIETMSPDRQQLSEHLKLQQDFNSEIMGFLLGGMRHSLIEGQDQEAFLDTTILLAKASHFDAQTGQILPAAQIPENLERLLNLYNDTAYENQGEEPNLREITGLSDESLDNLRNTPMDELVPTHLRGSNISISIELTISPG